MSVSPSGLATALQFGFTYVYAAFEGKGGTLRMVVTPPGTFTVSGSVREPGYYGLGNVRVLDMETFGAAEIWGLRASAMMVGTDAKADVPLPDTVRRYYFAGAQHGGGRGGFSLTGEAAAACELPANPIPEAQIRSALMKSFVGWVTTGAPMPASRYPKVADGTLVQNTNAAMGFPRIPGKPMPEHLQRPLIGYSVGSHFTYKDGSGYLTAVPAVEKEFPQLVVKVDADGNEVAGLKSPLAMAPLGTYMP